VVGRPVRPWRDQCFIEDHVLDLTFEELEAPVLGGVIAMRCSRRSVVALREQSSISCGPTTERRVVCATWWASKAFATDDGLAGINDAEVDAGFPFTETLSRVITSCFGTLRTDDAQGTGGSSVCRPDQQPARDP